MASFEQIKNNLWYAGAGVSVVGPALLIAGTACALSGVGMSVAIPLWVIGGLFTLFETLPFWNNHFEAQKQKKQQQAQFGNGMYTSTTIVNGEINQYQNSNRFQGPNFFDEAQAKMLAFGYEVSAKASAAGQTISSFFGSVFNSNQPQYIPLQQHVAEEIDNSLKLD